MQSVKSFLKEMLAQRNCETGLHTVNSEIFARVYFRETLHMRSCVKIISSRNAENALSVTDIGKSCPICEFFASQICLLTLFARIKFSQNFPDLQ